MRPGEAWESGNLLTTSNKIRHLGIRPKHVPRLSLSMVTYFFVSGGQIERVGSEYE